METSDEHYTSTFRQDCIDRNLDLTAIANCNLRTCRSTYPGFNRLAMCEQETTTMSWSWILRDLCAYLGGAQINNDLDIKSLNQQTRMFHTLFGSKFFLMDLLPTFLIG